MLCWLAAYLENALDIIAAKQLNSNRLTLAVDVSAKSSERFFLMQSTKAWSLSRVLLTMDSSWKRSGAYPGKKRTCEMLVQTLRGHTSPRAENTFNASLPNITIFAAGGTIAGSASSDTATIGYQAGALGIQTLIDAVPSMLNISNIKGVQVTNVASDNITPAILLNMTKQIQAELDSPYCQGVVVTHGTDSLEETAFFLALTVRTEKPIVIVGAMRPATAISADGPENLLASVTLAASPDALGRGPMVVLNDRIGPAYHVTKTNANQLDTLQGY